MLMATPRVFFLKDAPLAFRLHSRRRVGCDRSTPLGTVRELSHSISVQCFIMTSYLFSLFSFILCFGHICVSTLLCYCVWCVSVYLLHS